MSTKYKKSTTGSYLVNCYLQIRPDSPTKELFIPDDAGGSLSVLNGYAIIPLEEYGKLVGIEIFTKERAAQIAEADRQLHPEALEKDK